MAKIAWKGGSEWTWIQGKVVKEGTTKKSAKAKAGTNFTPPPAGTLITVRSKRPCGTYEMEDSRVLTAVRYLTSPEGATSFMPNLTFQGARERMFLKAKGTTRSIRRHSSF